MRNIIYLIVAMSIFSTVAGAGILYIEAPDEYSKEQLENPTDSISTEISDYIISEVNKVDVEVADRVVILTKNNEPVYLDTSVPNDEFEEVDDKGRNYLRFGEIRPIYLGWSKQEEILISANLEVIYPIAKEIFGKPIVTIRDYGMRIVTIEKDPKRQEWGYYDSYSDTIYLKAWPTGEVSVDRDTARAHLTRNMLHAFRRKAPATWDQFGGGITHAAWLEIQRRCAEDPLNPIMTEFNDLYHDSKKPDDPRFVRPYYHSMDQYNVYELSTNTADFFSGDSKVHTYLKQARFGTCGYLWWKVAEKDFRFISWFNEELTKDWDNHYFRTSSGDWYSVGRPSYQDLANHANTAYTNVNGLELIEGQRFYAWLSSQPMLAKNTESEVSLWVTEHDKTAYVFGFTREWQNDDPTEHGFGYVGSHHVDLDICNWFGDPIKSYTVKMDNGFCSQEYGYLWGLQRQIMKTSMVHSGKMLEARNSTIGGDQDNNDFYGAIDSELDHWPVSRGTLIVSDPATGEEHSIYCPYGAFNENLRDLFGDGVGIDRLHCEFVPAFPEYWIGFDLEFDVTMDKGQYGIFSIGNDQQNDLDLNQINDETEALLAQKFCPNITMHDNNPFIPHDYRITVENGWMVEYDQYQSDHYKFIRLNSDNWYDIAINHRNSWTGDWAFAFGNKSFTINPNPYWPDNYNKLKEKYNQPVVYWNIFYEGYAPVIQYWFFYPYNDWLDNHEGDWEHINVKITSPDPLIATPREVVYYFHRKNVTLERGVPWRTIGDISYYLEFDHITDEYFDNEGNPFDGWHVRVNVGGEGDSVKTRDMNDQENYLISSSERYPNVNTTKGGSGQSSGGSFPFIGTYYDVAIGFGFGDSAHEEIRRGIDVDHQRITLKWIGDTRITGGPKSDDQVEKEDFLFYSYPGASGRPARFISFAKSNETTIMKSVSASKDWFGRTPPHSPWHHECWESHKTFGYKPWDDLFFGEYSKSGMNTSSNSSPAFPFALHQSKPNPAKFGETNVAFSVPAVCRATLTVFDITGRKVAVPFDEEVAPGKYTAKINTASLAAGIYVYKLEAGKDKAIKKMIITY